ncbi:hypothetical protein [Haliangium sp.]|uniref:hypothetical protein n=1 Tax=Haliangium sp. TaxID=2663208 RepID=UPI003D127955
MEPLLNTIPGGKGAARADATGNVLEYTGPIDAETVCAVAAMSMNTLEDIGALLGLGSARGWGIVSDKRAMYVHRRSDELIVVEAQATKTPESILKKIAQAR